MYKWSSAQGTAGRHGSLPQSFTPPASSVLSISPARLPARALKYIMKCDDCWHDGAVCASFSVCCRMLACVELGQEAPPTFTDVACVCVFLTQVTGLRPTPTLETPLPPLLPMNLSFQFTQEAVSQPVNASFRSVNARGVILTLTRNFFESLLCTCRPYFTSFTLSSSSVALQFWRLVFLPHLGAVNKFMAQRGNYSRRSALGLMAVAHD